MVRHMSAHKGLKPHQYDIYGICEISQCGKTATNMKFVKWIQLQTFFNGTNLTIDIGLGLNL